MKFNIPQGPPKLTPETERLVAAFEYMTNGLSDAEDAAQSAYNALEEQLRHRYEREDARRRRSEALTYLACWAIPFIALMGTLSLIYLL